MIARRFVPLLFFLLSTSLLWSQSPPDTNVVILDSPAMDSDMPVEPIDSGRGHSVKTATLLALFPGAGQVYNGKIWKVPIVYAAMGTAIFFAVDNHQIYRLYLEAFYAVDGNPAYEDPFNGFYTAGQLIQLQDRFRRFRDLSIILAAAAYGLQILDAHVDAHLYYYDISDELSLHWEPQLIQTAWGTPNLGLGLRLEF